MVEKDDGIYAPANNGNGFDARRDGDENRGPLLLVVTIAVLLAFAAVVYTAYHQGLRKGGRDAAPHVSAVTGPIKTRPTDTHGTPTPNLGNRAYEPLDDVKTAPVEDIKTAPLPEEPLLRPVKKDTVPEVSKTNNDPAPAIAEKDVPPTATNPVPEKISPPPEKKKPVAEGPYLVQIAAFRSEDQALAAWDVLAAKLKSATGGLLPNVQRADLGPKGVYYRLRAGNFADRAAASGFCDQLKKSGRDCLVVRR